MEPTLLMLDEPTNHLDLNAVIWLNKYEAIRLLTSDPWENNEYNQHNAFFGPLQLPSRLEEDASHCLSRPEFP